MPKKYIHKSRGKTLQYPRGDLEKAVKAVESGAMSIGKASELHHVPKSTIADRVSGRFDLNAKPGRKPALPRVVEDKIVETVKLAAKSGVGVSRKNLLKRTGTLCKRLTIEMPMFKKGVPGIAWWEGLKKRYPELTIRKPEKLGTNRARALNGPITTSYFDYLGSLLDELNLKEQPARIWNADETRLRFEHDPVKVITEKGIKNVVGKTSEDRTNITILACGNAAGKIIPPLVIVKGKTSASLHGYNTVAAPPNTKWAFSDKGWMNDTMGEMWFRDLFLPECGPERPQLLIMDGHSSHETLGILEMAREENIHILCLPPHCTHFLQPLDRTVFRPFKNYYDEACSDYLSENSLNAVTKFSFPELFRQAFEASMTKSNLKNGFKTCGIYPFYSQCLPDHALAPSMPTDRPVLQSAENQEPVPSNSTSSDNTSPDLPTDRPILQSADNQEPSSRDYPFNSQCLPDHALAPSMPTDRPVLQSAENQEPVPSNSTSSDNTSPDLPTDRPILQSADNQEPSTSSNDVPPVSSTEVAESGDGINALKFLASTSILMQEQQQLEGAQDVSFNLEDPAQLLDLINQGLIDIIPCDTSIDGATIFTQTREGIDSSDLNFNSKEEEMPLVTPEVPISSSGDCADWNFEINNLFLPQTPSPTEKQIKKKKINSNHRLLTSSEIIQEKKEAAEKKIKKEAEKLLRLTKRQEKSRKNTGKIVVLK